MQNPIVNLLCLTHSVQMKMDLPAGVEPAVKACVSVVMPAKSEGEAGGNIALALVLDVSGSTVNPIRSEGAYNQIYKAIKSAAVKLVHLLREGDQVAVITFDDQGYLLQNLVAATPAGKENAIAAIEGISPQGGTDYNAGLQTAEQVLAKVSGMTRAIAFISDGAHERSRPDPRPLASHLRDSGTVIYTAGVSDNLDAEDEARLKEMSGGANFKACLNAGEVEGFFKTSLRKAQRTAVTNARVEFQPIGLVQTVECCDLVLKNGQRNFIAGTATAKQGSNPASGMVAIGEVGPGDRLDIFVRFKTRLPKFPENLNEQQRTFGRLILYGACPSAGINDPTELAAEEMYQRFARQTSGTVNPYTEKVAAQWEAAAAIATASQTANAAEQQRILEQAAAKVRRATQVFSDDEGLAGDLADLNALKQQAATHGGDAVKKAAGRKTAVFVDED